jgi:2-dehydro-3-deoxyphosphogluconate aldolase/(4S)-4-hydroxy-2-oxoglutarate aldolase
MTPIFAAANSVIPVLTLEDPDAAKPLADVLSASGFQVLEITLRTPAALEAISSLSRSHPELIVGAGTVFTREQVAAAAGAGAQFLVSPGFCDAVHVASDSLNLPYLPGVATATEAMAAYQHGYGSLKLFPANVAGGPTMLKALHTILPDVSFCPTGGIDEDTLGDYLREPNVDCVGGSWLAPQGMIRGAQWTQIAEVASSCARIVARSKPDG